MYVEPFIQSTHDVIPPTPYGTAAKATRTSVQQLRAIELFVQVSAKIQSILTNLEEALFFALTLFECCETRCSHADVSHISPYVTRPSPTFRRPCVHCTGSPRPALPEISTLYPKMSSVSCKYSNFQGWKCSFWLRF